MDGDGFELDTEQLGPLPIINVFAERLGWPGCSRRSCRTTTLGSSSLVPPRSGWSSATW
jgi:hypothetical protein